MTSDDAEASWSHQLVDSRQKASSSSNVSKTRTSVTWTRRRDETDSKEHHYSLGLRLLRSAPEPLIDLVFIHGLKGSSVDTWLSEDDPKLLWPQIWLPMEPTLRNVNVHTFGYDSGNATTDPSKLNVHDYGRFLLDEMRSSSDMRSDPESPIILLGHSIGGVVAKKTFLLAREAPSFENRIQCVVFLATPHRCPDYGATLNDILTVVGYVPSRNFMFDLTTGSTSMQLINEDFDNVAHGLAVVSFCETLPMDFGKVTRLVLDKYAATLGIRDEVVEDLAANHCQISKFASQDGSDYIKLRKALGDTAEKLLKGVHRNPVRDLAQQLKTLKTYLGVANRQENQFIGVDGSCEWIDERTDFQAWRDGSQNETAAQRKQTNPAVFWVYANPGSGKTFLAAHVGTMLRHSRANIASYFFHYGKKSSLSLSDLLRSIAYQLATNNVIVREALLALHDEGSAFDMDDTRTIWTVIFKQGIFQAPLQIPQFWIIDALDECKVSQELFTMLRGVPVRFPLRIFLTSRKLPDMYRMQRLLEPMADVTSIDIPEEDSTRDIKHYIRSRMETLVSVKRVEKEDIEHFLIKRSNACFLWVRMVLDELEKVYTYESRRHILEHMPDGMSPYYERTTRVMSENKLEKHIAKEILTWVAASSRNITIVELCHALRLGIQCELPEDKTAVEGLCGQFISVDDVSGLITIVHTTAREFLLSNDAGEFRVIKDQANEKIALVCLQLLSGPEMRPLHGRTLVGRKMKESLPQPLLDYAITQGFEHVYTASSETDDLLAAIDQFLKTKVLTWIEKVAEKGDLHLLIRASKNLKAYLLRRAKYSSPFSRQIQTISGWSVDLSRLVNRFGLALLEKPSAIYSLIPPLCPSSSKIYEQFGRRPDSLAILGAGEDAWNDCIASITFDNESIAAAFSAGDNLVAVGMESGQIQIYNANSCQKEGVVVQKDPVDLVHCTSKRIAASTTRSILLLDHGGNLIWKTRIRFRCILLTSIEGYIVAVSQHGHVLKWDISNGEPVEDLTFAYRNQLEDDPTTSRGVKAPSLASVSTDVEMLALAYTMGTVCIWEVESGELIGWARDETNRLASVLLFNPNPNVNLLLVMYTDHEMVLFESTSGNFVTNTRPTPIGPSPLSASCTLDGRTLATIDTIGNLRLWDFDSLSLLYHIPSPAFSFRLLSFPPSGSNLVDLTESSLRIWSPASLIRRNIEDDLSTSDTTLPDVVAGHVQNLRAERIIALSSHPSFPVVFAAKHSGGVLAYHSSSGKEMSLLYEHAHEAFVTHLAVSCSNIVASADVHGVVQVWQLGETMQDLVQKPHLLLHMRSTSRITQLLFSVSGRHLLIGTSVSDAVYSMEHIQLIGSMDADPDKRGVSRWVARSLQGQDQFMLICGNALKTFSASTFPFELQSLNTTIIYDIGDIRKDVNIESAVIQTGRQTLILCVRQSSGFVSWKTTYLFNLAHLQGHDAKEDLQPEHVFPTKICKYFIGTSDRDDRLIFLHSNSWLCSMDAQDITRGEFVQHFFVPNEYVSSKNEGMPTRTPDNNIVFLMNGQLAIIKNGLQFRDVRQIIC